MRRLKLSALGALTLVGLGAASASASVNLLANPGFEDPITTDGPPFVGSWEGFNAGPTSSAVNSVLSPRTGLRHASLSILETDNSFAGVFQDVIGLTPGTEGIFSGWHRTPSSPLDLGTEVRIEWRNSISNTEVGRTPNLTPIPGADYSLFSLTAVVPNNANSARVVYAIQSFGPEPTNNGSVFLDDVSFVIPEPSIAMLGVCGLGLMGMRRRRS
jgi:hypothetical protein